MSWCLWRRNGRETPWGFPPLVGLEGRRAELCIPARKSIWIHAQDHAAWCRGFTARVCPDLLGSRWNRSTRIRFVGVFAFTAAATFFSAFQVPYVALPAELTESYSQRTRLLTWRVVVLSVGILLFGAGGSEIPALFPRNPLLGYFVMGVVAALVLAIGLLIGATVAPQSSRVRRGRRAVQRQEQVQARAQMQEQAQAPEPKLGFGAYRVAGKVLKESQPFRALLATFVLQGLVAGLMLAGAQYVATWILHDEKAVSLLFASLIAPAIIFSPVWKALADRIGKEKAFKIASIGFMIAMLILTVMIWIPGWWITIAVALAGASYAGMQTLSMAMLPDVISYHAAQNAAKQNSAGIFSGIWTAGETVGMALGPPVLSIILMQTGYLQSTAGVSAVQSDLALTGIATAFSIVPAVLMGFSLLTLRRYHLNETDIEGARRA